jgi:hypothetical protein
MRDHDSINYRAPAHTRMVANGSASHPSVTGRALPLDCCDAAEFVVVTQSVPITLVPIVVMWRAPVGAPTALPATVDLANLPEGWVVRVDVGCDPAQGGCNPAPDSYTSGFTGTLEVARASAGYEMSLCLSLVEPAGSPHPLLHSLELHAPSVTAGY